MRAARFCAAKDIRVEEIPDPTEELTPHQVLVETQQCGICGTDLHEYLAGPIVTPATEHP